MLTRAQEAYWKRAAATLPPKQRDHFEAMCRQHSEPHSNVMPFRKPR